MYFLSTSSTYIHARKKALQMGFLQAVKHSRQQIHTYVRTHVRRCTYRLQILLSSRRMYLHKTLPNTQTYVRTADQGLPPGTSGCTCMLWFPCLAQSHHCVYGQSVKFRVGILFSLAVSRCGTNCVLLRHEAAIDSDLNNVLTVTWLALM